MAVATTSETEIVQKLSTMIENGKIVPLFNKVTRDLRKEGDPQILDTAVRMIVRAISKNHTICCDVPAKARAAYDLDSGTYSIYVSCPACGNAQIMMESKEEGLIYAEDHVISQ